MPVIAPKIISIKSYPLGSQETISANNNYSEQIKPVNGRDSYREPLKAVVKKNQVAFKGSSSNMKFLTRLSEGIGKFFKGGDIHEGKVMYNKVIEYLSEDSPFVLSLKYHVDRHGLMEKEIRTQMPFHENLGEAFLALPNFIYKKIRGFFDGDFVKKMQNKQAKIKTRDNLLGIWMHIVKYEKQFENATSGTKLNELKKILNKSDNKEELEKFFQKNKVKDLYFLRDGEAVGLLASEQKFENFKTAVLRGDSLKDFQKEFIEDAMDRTIRNKQGSHLPTYGHTGAQFIARVVSGVIPAWFIANDFYNLKIANTNDKKEAKKEWKSKLAQENSRIAINAWSGFVMNTCFEKLTNMSLPFAFGVSAITSVISNVLSRIITNRPVMPVNVNAAVRLKEETEHKKAHKKQHFGFGANSNALMKPFKGMSDFFLQMDKKLYKSFPEHMSINEFTKAINQVHMLEPKDSIKMLKIVVEEMGLKNVTVDSTNQHEVLNSIKQAAAKNYGSVTVGASQPYRVIKGVLGIFTVPYDIIKGITIGIINFGRWVVGAELLKSKKKDSLLPEQFIKNSNIWANNAVIISKINLTEKEINSDHLKRAKILYGNQKKKSFGTKVLNYAADALSNATKLTGFVSVPFLAVDAYNTSLGDTKSTNEAKSQSNQRALQDSTRQGVSFWFTKVFNTSLKQIYNSSLWGSAAVVAIQASTYETFTRWLVGQPLLPASHEKMAAIDNKRANSNSWFTKAMCRKITRNDNGANAANIKEISANNTTDKNQINIAALPKLNTELRFSDNPKVSQLYNSFINQA